MLYSEVKRKFEGWNPKGNVVNEMGKNNGYIKNNGTYVDLDKKISGYALPEVAKNRRN